MRRSKYTWLYMHTHTYTDLTDQTIKPPNNLTSQGENSVGGGGGTEEEEGENWWKIGLFHSSLEMLSLACSVCCFPHGFQMLPWAALTQSVLRLPPSSSHAECKTAAASMGVRSVICQWYSIPALRSKLRCVGGQQGMFYSLLDEVE